MKTLTDMGPDPSKKTKKPGLDPRMTQKQEMNQVLPIRIRNPVPSWPLDLDPDPEWTTRIIFPRAEKQFFFWVKTLQFFDPGFETKKFRSLMEKIMIRDKHLGSATLDEPIYPSHTRAGIYIIQIRIAIKKSDFNPRNIKNLNLNMHKNTKYNCRNPDYLVPLFVEVAELLQPRIGGTDQIRLLRH
jgi:hypothetical protein